MTEETREVSKKSERSRRLREAHTYIVPFIVLSFLVLPSLAVLAFTKQTLGFGVLEISTYYVVTLILLWIMTPLVVLTGGAYLVLAKNIIGRFFVLVMLAAVLAGFAFAIWPL